MIAIGTSRAFHYRLRGSFATNREKPDRFYWKGKRRVVCAQHKSLADDLFGRLTFNWNVIQYY